ncbi:type I restriction endonuclease subunit R, EcoR124 family [Bifidobacterium saguinibicoloris]|uniref:type I restriction endonuclease subunit R, EcoR124 family n=1 Tax=Bifidobacterium saguinibicoloris TaxID=2834433 RepID=UPI001C588453|nr:HsdR family type I site-specific deoxyribonuclease [Bifidobacterium saguinibicoloris]MBW3080712.1 HsdR family type I site-specific deoxyribonuclease [Bifidobacterium saguinibicoloris]
MIFDKESDFEESVISVLQQHGWKDGLLRYPTEKQLLDNWKSILYRNNSGIDRLSEYPLTDGEMAQIVEQIETLRTPLALNSFVNGRTVSITRDNKDDKAHFGKEVSLYIYDRKEIAGGKSTYQIAQQPVYPAQSKMQHARRGDLVLLINGMPLIHIELKKSGVPVSQATGQIEKYSHEGVFTGLFRLVQIFVAMNPDDAVYFANPGPDKFNPSYYFHWADFNNEPICGGLNPGKDEWKLFIGGTSGTAGLLSIPMAHQLIGFYTIADSADGCLKVLRSYQYIAANAISDIVRKTDWEQKPSTPGRPGGYVWHTTGSGKTMTSFKSAQLIADSHDADKVVFLMDRIELGTQSLKEYRSFADSEDDVQGTENTGVLRDRLASDDPKDTLIVTSIQKMSNVKPGESGVTQTELDRMAAKRVVFIVDECHRSTFGDMLQDIRRSFPNALFFGFTGTPILDENQKKHSTTAMLFGNELHRYSIADGIRDHNVLGFDPTMVTTYKDDEVRLKVALDKAKAGSIEEALEKTDKTEVYEHYMDKALVPMAAEADDAGTIIRGIEDYLGRDQYGIDTPHPGMVVADILEHVPVLSRGGKFHGILATSSIPGAINYYHLFKKQASGLHVTALFDPNVDNAAGATVKGDALVEIMDDYNTMYGKDFGIVEWPAMKRDISSRLSHKAPYGGIDKAPEQRLDLLIVVDQMLTGFDSKWVNTLYLDKIIEYESIIQAFSRTNRLFGPDKPFGVIRYYRKPHTMRRNIEHAVKLYSGDRPLGLFVQKLPKNIEAMDSRYREILDVFAGGGAEDLAKLPESVEAKRKFAKEFVALNRHLEAAKVQGFDWSKTEYVVDAAGDEIGDGLSDKEDTIVDDDVAIDEASHEPTIIRPEIDERTYLILAQRYKELFGDGNDGGNDEGNDGTGHNGGDDDPEAPYELEGYLTAIDTGLIDTDYMNANFVKWLKALKADSPELAEVTAQLHRSFAALSKDEQRLAELFLHDVERGDVVVEENLTLRDYITRYAKREKDEQIDKIVDKLGVDRSLLEEFTVKRIDEMNINEFGRFDKLMASVDRTRARAFFEEQEHRKLPSFKVPMYAQRLLKRFVLEGGFDIATAPPDVSQR